jgi:hypothetical protein
MRCELFRTDPATLISTLGSDAMLRRYQAATAAELPALADRPLLAHLRRLDALAGRALALGFTALATEDAAAADALLTDVFAVGTWQGWELPAERLADAEVAVDDLPRGLLGQDPGREGAALWILDHGRIALARLREASGDAEWHPHHPEGGCRH